MVNESLERASNITCGSDLPCRELGNSAISKFYKLLHHMWFRKCAGVSEFI